MVFPTIEFAAFLVLVMFASWLLMPNPRYWKPFMLAVSLFFIAFADVRWAGLLVLSIIGNQFAATLIARTHRRGRRKTLLIAALVFNLGLLGLFKYYGFFVDSVNSALDAINFGMPLPLLELALPVGISFFTFQAISYVVDVYKGEAELATPIDYAVYASFFPHLVAGPIVRAREFIPQLAHPRSPRNLPITPALFLIAGGLFKKVVLADMLAARLVDPVFANPDAYSAADTFVAIIGYAAQIYCDFSAYTDIAIGVAMLLGFRFPQNFNRPYTAASLQEFWRRWHMTLSRWLRDYVYIPLGGNRKGSRRTYINLILTMLLGGLWHGAAWTFVLWGGIHASGLAFEKWATQRRAQKLWQPQPKVAGGTQLSIDLRPDGPRLELPQAEPKAGGPDAGGSPGTGGGASRLAVATRITTVTGHLQSRVAPSVLRAADAIVLRNWPKPMLWLVTFGTVCFAWVFFRASSLGDALAVLGRLVTGWGEATTLVTPTILVVLAAALGAQFIPQLSWRRLEAQFGRLPIVAQGIAFGIFLVTMNAIIGQQGVAPFIYFRF